MTFRSMILISALLLGACSQNEPTLNAIESSQLSNADDSHRQEPLPVLEPLVLVKWQTSCALCHIDGNGGAPKIGFEEDWSELAGKSKEELLASTVEGLNNMPPLGYCMSCEESDFLAMISFMKGDTH